MGDNQLFIYSADCLLLFLFPDQRKRIRKEWEVCCSFLSLCDLALSSIVFIEMIYHFKRMINRDKDFFGGVS